MHISIIIPVFNLSPFLRDTVNSVLRQTYRDWSMIIVDDGSTDDSVRVVSALDDSRIHLIQQAHGGVSAARNRGIARALGIDDGDAGRAPVGMNGSVAEAGTGALLFLDGDDLLEPESLRCMAEGLRAMPQAVACWGRFGRIRADGSRSLSSVPSKGSLLEHLMTRNLFANGGHVLIRRDAVISAGGFRLDMAYGEDWEYWTRLALLGDFVPLATRAPVLWVRERSSGASAPRATDPDAYRAVLRTIHANPAISARLGRPRLAALNRQAEAELAWAVGRAHLRGGKRREGIPWLLRSLRLAPSAKRAAICGWAWLPWRSALL